MKENAPEAKQKAKDNLVTAKDEAKALASELNNKMKESKWFKSLKSKMDKNKGGDDVGTND